MSTPNSGAPASAAPEASSTPNPTDNNESVNEDQGDSVESGLEDVAAEAEAIVADPTASKAEKAAAKKMIKTLKLKVDGKEYDEELPFEIEDDPKKIEWMQKHLQLSKVAGKRMQEKAETEAEIRDFIEALKNNPEEVLSNPHINLDLKKFATQIIERELENEKKSPEQLKLEKAEAELRKLKDEQTKEKEAREKARREQINQEAVERYDMLLDQALEKNKDIPKSAWSIKRISDYMIIALQNGIDITPEEVIPLVREDRKKELSDMFAASNDDLIEELVGKERLNGMRKKKVADAKSKAVTSAAKVVDTGTNSKKIEKEAEKKMTIRDFFKV